MSVTVTLNGTDYTIPSPGDSDDWGAALNAYLIALAAASSGAVLSVGPLGSEPNASGASIASGVLTLQPSQSIGAPGSGGGGGIPGLMSASDKDQLNQLGVLNPWGTANTTDATPVDVDFSLPATEDGQCLTVQVIVGAGEKTGGGNNTASYGLVALFKNIGGVVTKIGSTTVLWTIESAASWNATLVTDGTDIFVTVTGEVAANITWVVSGRLVANFLRGSP